jgi:aryl-alcohol dehydrogenase-like predicted oxidoreductase
MAAKTAMKYRFLGNTGLLVSRLSFGTMVAIETQNEFETAYAIMERAFQRGVNFFDSAEIYNQGRSEEALGRIVSTGIERGAWTREDLVISTKLCWGTKRFVEDGAKPNSQWLTRKHIVEGTKASLKRLGMDYVDLIMCHRPDPRTPIEETVRAMNFVIDQGWAFYWGTSEWSAESIIEACEVADRLGLIRPVCCKLVNGRTAIKSVAVRLMYNLVPCCLHRSSIRRSTTFWRGRVLSLSTTSYTR